MLTAVPRRGTMSTDWMLLLFCSTCRLCSTTKPKSSVSMASELAWMIERDTVVACE
jgi:hypothetical protein